MPSFTLVVPTLGRTSELHALFASLALQKFPDLECLVVDQNTDGRLDPILEQWEHVLPIRRLRGPAGVARSRNLGLLHATGDLVAFPDDDCWYPDGLLASLAAWFDEHPGIDILTVGACDLDGVASGNRWPQNKCVLRPINAFRTTFCSSIFLRRTPLVVNSRFDEAIGPGAGTPWACGEETDFILDLLRRGAKGVFDRSWSIGHPKRDMLSGTITAARAAGYGRGMGRVLRKQALYPLGAGFLLYDLVRSFLVLLRGDRKGAALCLHHGIGILTGLTRSTAGTVAIQGDHAQTA